MASEEMSFANVDDGRQWTTDAYLYYKLTYEPSAQVSKKYLFMKKLLKDNYGDINNTVQWYSSVDQASMLTVRVIKAGTTLPTINEISV